ncbi:MAG TPA: 3-phosphoshikimate 1-carboxyvinyltransferase, partial [Methylotenera sp.]|nr:3-phosphoshikimate 1-carboxyvinyltransferase [Methylotenera sp.]
MEQLNLPAASHASGQITLPGSKSISNRTLLLAALSTGTTEIHDLLASDDTDRMLEALKKLDIKLENFAENAWRVTGCNGNFPNKNAELFLGNAGTAFRPLTAALAFSNGNYHLSGVPRMHERPIGDLVDALRQAGADIEYLANDGFPPLKIAPAKLDLSNTIKIRGDVSSQFLTALLMALPLTGQTATIEVVGELISKPYIEITLNLMAKFGVIVEREGWERFTILANSSYQSPGRYYVEGDASSASYFLAAGAIGGGPVRVIGISKDSIQGDVKFAYALGKDEDRTESLYTTTSLSYMGAQISWSNNYMTSSAPISGKLRALDLDCNHIPDAAMTLAILALFAEGTTTLSNIASWR